jgi:PAS domain S-box-containing protein
MIMNRLNVLHYHKWADHSELVNTSIQEFTFYDIEIKHVYDIDQLQIDLFSEAITRPIVLIDIDLVTPEVIKGINSLIIEKGPICVFVLTADNRTSECIKLLELELCGYLSLQDFNAHALEQHLALVYRDYGVHLKALEDVEKLKLLQLGLNQSASCIVITNIDGEIEYVNDAFEKLTGYSRQEVMGQNPRVLKSGAQPEEFYVHLWETIVAGQQWQGEFKNKKKDGTYYWERASISPIFDRKGRVSHFIAVKENITEQKRISDELKLSEERHARAQRIGNIGHWVLDIATSEIEWSEQTYSIYGKSKDFKPSFDSVIACMLPQDINKVKQAISLSIENSVGNSLIHRINAEGSIKYVEERWEVLHNQNQELTHLIGTCLDITAQKALEFNFQLKSEILRSVLTSMDDLVFVLDANGNFYEFYQTERADLLLTDPELFIGKHYSEVLPSSMVTLLDEKFLNVRDRHVIETLEYSLIIQGTVRWFNAKISLALSPEGKRDRFTVVVRDITDERLVQQALKESEQKYRIQSDLLPHVHWVSRADGQTIYINRKGHEFYGEHLSLDQLSSWSLLNPSDVGEAMEIWKVCLAAKSEYSNIERHRHHNGQYHWMQVNATPVLDEKEEISYWIGIATDIDELINIRNEKDKLLFDLNERIKEVKCLYLISYLAQSWKGELNAFFNEILPIITEGFTYPEHTQIKIIYEGKKYQSSPLTYKNRITQDIVVSNVKMGEIVLAIPINNSLGERIYFLNEEHRLLDAIAANIGLVIERSMKDSEIKESQEKFETLVQNATIGIGILKGEVWIDSNVAFEKILGAQKAEIIGSSPWDFSPKYQPDGSLSKNMAQMIIVELKKKESMSFYWQHKRLDDQLIDCEIQINKVLMNGEYHILVFLRDITQEKAAITRLVEKEAEYRNIFNNIQEGYMLMDMEGEIVSINPAGVKMIGADSIDNIVGKNASLYFTSNIKELFTNSHLIDDGKLTDYELELLSDKGEVRSVEFNLRLVKKENTPWLIETTFRDVTEKVGREKLKAATLKLYEAYEIGYDHLIQVGLDLAVDLLNSKIGFYHIVNEKEEMVQLVQWSKGTKELIEVPKLVRDYPFKEAGIWIEAIKTKVPVVHNDYKALNRKGALPKGHIDLIRDLEVPLLDKGVVQAIIGVGNKEHLYSELDQQLLQTYAQTFYSILSRKRAEDEYLNTLEIFDQSQQVGRIGAWRFDVAYDDTWWSDVMFDIYGLKSEKGVPSNWLEFTHPDDRKGMTESFENALISGTYKYEYRLIRPDGEIRNIYAQARVEFDDENKPKYYVGIAQDITEITRALDQLHTKNRQFENIVDSVPGVVYRFSYPNVDLMYLSDYVTKMLGYTKKEIEDNLNLDFVKGLVHPDDWEEVTDQVLASFESSESYFLNYRMITSKGQIVWVSNSGKIIKDEQGLILEGFVFDVTDRVKGEEKIMNAVMQTADHEKARISKEIHDSLQQTLTIASLNLGYLVRERESLSDKAKPKLDLGMEYLKKSLDDSREIAHRLMPKAIEDFGLVPVVEGMIEELNRNDEISIQFNTNMYGRRIKLSVANNLYKIIQEALNNILKHANAEVVTIQYMLLGDTLQLSIEDDGVGFDHKLFKNKDLSGFGLASMRSRAIALSAEFYIDSYPGHGTTIMIELPFTKEIEYLAEGKN